MYHAYGFYFDNLLVGHSTSPQQSYPVWKLSWVIMEIYVQGAEDLGMWELTESAMLQRIGRTRKFGFSLQVIVMPVFAGNT